MRSVERIWAIALEELRTSRRLVRAWLIFCLACCATGYQWWYLSSLHAYSSSVSPSLGIFSPRFLLSASSADLLLIFQIGVVALAIDFHSRDVRSRIADALTARPFTNLELVVGRNLGATTFMVVSVVSLMTMATVTSFVSYHLEAPVGEKVELYSTLSFVVLNSIPNLAFWSALTIFVVLVVQDRFIAATLSMVLIGGVYIFNSILPTYLSPALSM